MPDEDLPPSADPDPDHERLLREIGDAKPKLGCLGLTITGPVALLTMALLALLVIYLVGRCAS